MSRSSITKEKIEEIFSQTYVLRPPKNIIILDKPASEIQCDNGGCTLSLFRGLQPVAFPDIIILTSLADGETVLHEVIHTYGIDELGAYPLGRIAMRINGKIPKFRKRTVKYEKCSGCNVRKTLDKLGLVTPPNSHPVHYVRLEP